MSKLKLKDGVAAKIRAGRDGGATYKDLATRFKVSEGTVRNALRGDTPTTPKTVPIVEANSASPPPTADFVEAAEGAMTREDLRILLADHVRDLRDNLTRTKASGDQAAIASAARNLTQASTLLSRVTPDPPPAVDPNESLDIRAAAESARTLFFTTLENIIGNRGRA